MRILAFDPGPAKSAYVLYETLPPTVMEYGHVPNEEAVKIASEKAASVCVIEMIASYGMSVGREVFETCVVIGRLMQARADGPCQNRTTTRITRGEVKDLLCHSRKAKDSNIRTELIDRFGGSSAIGRKATPGPLYGVAGDVWAALAVAVAYAEEPPF